MPGWPGPSASVQAQSHPADLGLVSPAAELGAARRRGRPCAHLAWLASSAGCGSRSRRRKARGLPSSPRDGGQSARLARCTGQPGTLAWPAETLVPGVGSLGGATMSLLAVKQILMGLVMSAAGTGTLGGSAATARGSGSPGPGGTAGMAPQGRPAGVPAAVPVTGTPGVQTRRWGAMPRRWWQRGSPAAAAARRVPWWGVVSAVAAPLLLAAGWTVAAGLQPQSFNAIAGTVSALAAVGAADRWVMSLAFAAAGACEVITGLALRPAAAPRRSRPGKSGRLRHPAGPGGRRPVPARAAAGTLRRPDR